MHDTIIRVDSEGVWDSNDECLSDSCKGSSTLLSVGGSRHFYAYEPNTFLDAFGDTKTPESVKANVGELSIVACGFETTGAIFGSRDLQIWNREGEIVKTHLFDFDVTKFAMGFGHGLVLSNEGKVHGFGASDHGQAGGEFSKENSVNLIPMASKIIDLCCGSTHSLLLDCEGSVYSFGSAGDGKLGLGTDVKDQCEPQKLNLKEKIVKICAGADHSVVVGKSGSAYAFGFGQHGATGTGRFETEESPRQVEGLKHVTNVWLGTDFTLFEEFVPVEIWHNEKCSKSRGAMSILKERGIEPIIVDYQSPGKVDKERLKSVLSMMGEKVSARALLRANDAPELEHASEEELIRAMVENPRLIERPLVIVGDKARLGRPNADCILTLLD